MQKAAFTVGGATVPARVVAGGEDFIGFAVDQPLRPGAAKLHVEWKGNLSRKDDRGLFAQKEGDRWYAITQFEAIFARRVFPCFDEPNSKVPWQLTLEVPKALAALSNTTVVGEKSEHPGMKTVTFAQTAPLPTYLVAFAVGPYELVSAGTAGQKKIAMRVAAPFGRGKDARTRPRTRPSSSSSWRSTSASRSPTTSSTASPSPSPRPSAPWRTRAW